MKIAVCIKRVPVMEVKFAITADGSRVDESGLKYDVNDFDLWAIEAGLQLKEKNGNVGEVVVITLGTDAAQEQIRKALAMGADRGVLLQTDRAPADGLAVARALAAELKDGGYDLILCGRIAIDSMNQMTGPMIAELLDVPCVTNVFRLDISGATGRAERVLEGGSEVVEFPLPALLTIDDGLNKERLPSLKGIMAAKKKPMDVKPAQFGEARVTVARMSLPPERAAGRILGDSSAAVPELVRLLQTEAKVLLTMANVLVVAEVRGGDLRKVALEAVTAARALADQSGGGNVHALLAGAPGIGAKAAALAQHGADTVLVLEHAAFAMYNPEALAATIAQRVSGGAYGYALFSATSHGRDLSPRVAAKLGAGLVPDLTEFRVEGGAVVGEHPQNNGKVVATLSLSGAPAIIQVRPAAFQPTENARPLVTEAITSATDPAASRVKTVELKQGGTGKIDLNDAPVIVAGGRGLKAAENFKLCEDLADAFGNAAVGATRAVTDEGWRPHTDQIGQTGRNVSPSLYIAVGISGAIQHLAGMRTSKTIVAINKDKDAPIFKIADYGIVGDVFEVMPALTAAVKAVRAQG